jgi:16S rRNA (uracil1498-N3)-methyltransferase
MHRFYLPPSHCQGPALALTGTEAHHAADVLRVKKGETVLVLDGAGREFECVIGAADRKSVALSVIKKQTSPAPASSVTLVQAIPKGKLIETIIQKATELGAARIVPLLSERVIVRLDDDGAGAKAEKWRHTAIEAIKQCGQRWLPQVEAPITLPALLERGDKFDLSLIGSLRDDARHPREYFDAFRKLQNKPPASVCVWIGPEGDFTDAELSSVKNMGARPMSLGPLILRSDTAALYALSIVSYELQSWPHPAS